MTIPSETLAVISTAHLPEVEAKRIPTAIERRLVGGITGMSREEGFLIYTKQVIDNDLPHLNYILGFLRATGFVWVLFDCDAEAIEDLEVFNW